MKDKPKVNVINNKKIVLVNQPKVFFLFLCFCFISITGRLFGLQILEGAFYRQLSDENRIRLVSRPPIRGRLLDRNRNILADNKLTYALSIQPRLVPSSTWPLLRKNLSDFLKISEDVLDLRFKRGLGSDPFRITLARDLNAEQVLRFKE